jgi:hypothetical protein
MNHRAVPAALLLLLVTVASAGCASHSLEQRLTAAGPAVSALHDGSFDRAGREADAQIGADSANPVARLVRAIVRYKRSMHQASLDVRTVVIGGIGAGAFNHKYLRASLEQTESDLAGVEDDLAAAATAPASRSSCASRAGRSTGTATAGSTRAIVCSSRSSATAKTIRCPTTIRDASRPSASTRGTSRGRGRS